MERGYLRKISRERGNMRGKLLEQTKENHVVFPPSQDGMVSRTFSLEERSFFSLYSGVEMEHRPLQRESLEEMNSL